MLNFSAHAKRKILFVTGTRADYGKLEPLAIEAADAGFPVTFFVTGMHMMAKYGLTKTEIHRNSHRFKIVEYINQRDGDPQDIVAAKTIIGFSDFLKEMRPDLVVIHGDRVEALACALVSAMNYILCAHIEGGEVSGTIDEIFRHCNTKLSSIHLVSSKVARERVLRLGETTESVEIIGSPELDIHAQSSGVSLPEVLNRYEIASDDYGIVIFHPVTSEVDTIRDQVQSVFSVLKESGRYFVLIMPNNDPGSKEIIEEIETLPRNQFRVLPSMRFHYFSELLRNAKLMLGNSSSGVREAPYLGIPSMTLGTRQANRSTAKAVFTASCFDRAAISSFVAGEWGKRYDRDNSFGEGLATKKFRELLLSPRFWERPRQKYFADV
ncbi:MAG TPA: UDP-N-acetylglucosamine 2-epimerase [Rhizobiaceae bacterium]|nr:UDP-N-acetylglucosamine 2-epimerase [Rhizobiaceae bacterium]